MMQNNCWQWVRTYMHYNYTPYMQVKSDTLKGYVVYAQDL